MSEAELESFESLELDAASIAKLQAVINSDEVDEDAITEDLLGGSDSFAGVPATAHIEGKKVEVHAPTIHKKFKGEWNRPSHDKSKGKLFSKHKLHGEYKIRVNLAPKKTVIIFKKVHPGPPHPKPDAVYVGDGTSPGVVSGQGHGHWQ